MVFSIYKEEKKKGHDDDDDDDGCSTVEFMQLISHAEENFLAAWGPWMQITRISILTWKRFLQTFRCTDSNQNAPAHN